MNYDLITKLAKLANNNPNEHEANLAARKVCKLLAEGKFTFTNWSPEPKKNPVQQQPVYRSASNPVDNPFADFFKKRQDHWNNYGTPPKQEKTASEKLKEEQERKARAQWTTTDYDFGGFATDDLFDMINKIMEERKRRGYTDTSSDNDYWINEFARQRKSWVDPTFKPPSKQKEERFLKCKTCGNQKLTKFVGLPELYECNTCQWTAYAKK
jgi:hypothetical protein